MSLSAEKLKEMLAQAHDPEAIAVLIGKPEARAIFSELLELRQAIAPFVEFISNDTNHRLPDDMPLTVGSPMARRQLTVRHFRALQAPSIKDTSK